MLHWLNIFVCMWLCNMCLICKHWYSMENGRKGECHDIGISFKSLKMSDHSVWAFKRDVGFTNMLLLGYFKDQMFKQSNCVSHNTFKFLCESLSLYLQRKNTHMRETFSIEGTIAMSLQRIGTRNILCTIGEVYGVAKSIIS